MASISKKILIIEDNKLLQQVYFDKLVKDGFVVLQAFTGRQGLALATNYHPDLVVGHERERRREAVHARGAGCAGDNAGAFNLG